MKNDSSENVANAENEIQHINKKQGYVSVQKLRAQMF